MKTQWIGIFWAVAGLAALLVVFSQKTAKQIQTNGREQAYVDLEREALAASRLVAVQTDALAKDLQRAVAQISAVREKSNTQKYDGPAAVFGDFTTVGLLRLNGQGQWEPDWLEISEEMGGRATDAQIRGALKDLPFAAVGPLAGVYARLQDPTLSTSFIFLMPVKKPGVTESLIALGVVPGPVFSKWSEIFKGSDRDLIVMDDHGFAVALSEPAYVGTLMDKHPFVAEVLKARPTALRSETKNLRAENILGAAEKLEHTNLYVLVTRPFPSFARMVSDLFLQNSLYCIAIALLTGWMLWFSWRPTLRPVNFEMSHVNPDAAPTPASVETAEEKKPLDRTEAYQIVGPGLVQAMKGPISVILGHAQLAQAKSADPKMQENLSAIEKESRRLRETLESLSRVSGAALTYEQQKVDLQDVISKALAEVRGDISEHAISLVRNLNAPGLVMASARPLQDMFVELFKNAIEALEGCPKKEIKVSCTLQDQRFVTVIEDTGVGVSEKDFEKLFQPFFTTKDVVEHAGLSLSMARGLLRGFGGEIQFTSQPNKGTQVKIELPAPVTGHAAIRTEIAEAMTASSITVVPPIATVAPPPLAASTKTLSTPATAASTFYPPVQINPPMATPPTLKQTEPKPPAVQMLDEITVVSELMTLGGKMPLDSGTEVKLPATPPVEALPPLNEEDEEWQQLPRQLHSDVAQDKSQKSTVEIRKPKVRLKV